MDTSAVKQYVFASCRMVSGQRIRNINVILYWSPLGKLLNQQRADQSAGSFAAPGSWQSFRVVSKVIWAGLMLTDRRSWTQCPKEFKKFPSKKIWAVWKAKPKSKHRNNKTSSSTVLQVVIWLFYLTLVLTLCWELNIKSSSLPQTTFPLKTSLSTGLLWKCSLYLF